MNPSDDDDMYYSEGANEYPASSAYASSNCSSVRLGASVHESEDDDDGGSADEYQPPAVENDEMTSSSDEEGDEEEEESIQRKRKGKNSKKVSATLV